MKTKCAIPDEAVELTGTSRSSFKEAVEDALSRAPAHSNEKKKARVLRYVAKINEESCLEFQAFIELAAEDSGAQLSP